MPATADALRASPSTEQYLAVVFVMEEDGEEVVQARVAERLGHSAPTVSEVVQRLKRDGYLRSDGRILRLTTKGREVASRVVYKHRLAARFLSDVLGLPWHTVHAEALRWEHVMSDDVAERLQAVLGRPTTCPHGCPVPGACDQTDGSGPLTDAAVGERVCFSRICGLAYFTEGALSYLEDHHFVPGAEATVVGRGPDGTMVLSVGDDRLVLGAQMATRLYCSAAG